MKLTSFEKWQDTERKERDEKTIVICRACNGAGEVECDCSCENCECVTECGHFDGKGQLPWGDVDNQSAYLNIHGYREAIRADLEFVSKKKSKPLEEVALSFGVGSLCKYRPDSIIQDVEVKLVLEFDSIHLNGDYGIMRCWF